MKTKQLIILALLGILSLNLIAQNEGKITGKIVDANTGLPIEFANIYSNISGQGTISNNEGVFLYKTLNGLSADSLVISNIGYRSIRLSISMLLNSPEEVIDLIPVTYTLNEVSIKPLPEAKEIIAKAKENLDKNYSQNPFLAECYFSEFTKEDGSYVRAMELALLQYNKGGFPNPYIAIPMQQIKIEQKRKSANHTVLTNSLLNRCFSLNYLFLTSNLRSFLAIKNFNFTLDSVSIIDNTPVYIITGIGKTEKIIYSVSQDGYRILQIVFQWNYALPRYRIGENFFSINRTEGKLLFKEIGKIVYPFYTSNKLEINYYLNKDDITVWHKQEIESELLYTNIITENIKQIDENERLEILLYPNIYELEIPYNESFWNQHIYIEESLKRKQIYDAINAKTD